MTIAGRWSWRPTATTPRASSVPPSRRMKTDASKREFGRAKALFPGGVNSPVRAFRGVGGDPLFIARGEKARVVDEDGNSYIDYVLSWGPLLAGHAHPRIVQAI